MPSSSRTIWGPWCIIWFSITAEASWAEGLTAQLDSRTTESANAQLQVDDIHATLYMGLTTLSTGSSQRHVRGKALEDLRWDDLPANRRRVAQSIVRNAALFRRSPELTFEVSRPLFDYFIQHPEVAVSTWRALDISRLELKRLSPQTYLADAKDGSSGQLEVWRHTADEIILYCQGAFRSPVLTQPVLARAIIRLKLNWSEATSAGMSRLRCYHDLFVEFPSPTIETISKVISPVSYSISDRNFRQLALYMHLMSQVVIYEPAWLEMIVAKMDLPQDQIKEFVQQAAGWRRSNFGAVTTGSRQDRIQAVVQPLKLTATSQP